MKSLVEDYNACVEENSDHIILFDEALHPTALEGRLQVLGVWCQGTMPERREIMDSYLLLCRSKEEVAMLTEDIQNIIKFYEAKKTLILKAVDDVESANTLYHRGVSSLLYRLLQHTSSLLEEAKNIFACMFEGNDDELTVIMMMTMMMMNSFNLFDAFFVVSMICCSNHYRSEVCYY